MQTARHQPPQRSASRRPLRRHGLARLTTALLFVGMGASALAVPTFVLTPSSSTVVVGEVFALSLKGTSFGETAGGTVINNVSGGQAFSFSYGAAGFEIVSISIAPRWNFSPANKTGTIDAAAGTVTGFGFGAFPGATDDDFDIATFTLKALASGPALLSMTTGQVVGTVGGAPGQSISAMPAVAALSIKAVPEPAPAALLLLGLGAIVALRSRRGAPPVSPPASPMPPSAHF